MIKQHKKINLKFKTTQKNNLKLKEINLKLKKNIFKNMVE
jgi:hypothetical protein